MNEYKEFFISIEKNCFLTEDEKKIIKNNLSILDDFNSYLNFDLINDRLSSLKIKYNKLDIEDRVADYKPNINTITIYCANNILECPENVIIHELLHMYSNNTIMEGIGLIESITETIACEYCNISKIKERAFRENCLVLYSLCELIGVDNIKKFYFSSDIDIIKDALCIIEDDEIKTIKLISNIDAIMDYYCGKEYKNKVKDIYDIINDYCKKKYESNIIMTSNINPYLYNSLYNVDTTIELNNYDCKGYFISNYIKEHPKVTNNNSIYIIDIFINKIKSIILKNVNNHVNSKLKRLMKHE